MTHSDCKDRLHSIPAFLRTTHARTVTGRCLPAICLSLLVVHGALAQDDTRSTPAATGTNTTRPIEEISVRGRQSLMQLRVRIEQKQAAIFAFFNDNNSNDRYDIVCSKRRVTGTYILSRNCEPRFLRDLRVDRTRQFRMGIGLNVSQRELVELAEPDFRALQEEMQALMAAHPAFSRDLANLAEMEETYQTRRQTLLTPE